MKRERFYVYKAPGAHHWWAVRDRQQNDEVTASANTKRIAEDIARMMNGAPSEVDR